MKIFCTRDVQSIYAEIKTTYKGEEEMQHLTCQECGHVVYDSDEHEGVLINDKPCKAWNFQEYAAHHLAVCEATNDVLVKDNTMYHAFHETEKTMRKFAEEDIGKFKKIFGRFYWLSK